MHKFTIYTLNNVMFFIAIFFVFCSCTGKNSSICYYRPPSPTQRALLLPTHCGHTFPSWKVFLIGLLGYSQWVLRHDWGPYENLCMVGCLCVSTLLNFKILFLKRYVSQTQQGIFCITRVFLDPTACKIGIYVTLVDFFMFWDTTDRFFVLKT